MTRFERWAVWTTSVATAATGLAYAGMKYLMAPQEPWAVVNHPLQPWALKAHILVAPFLIFAVGLIASRHVWRHLRGNVAAGRQSGLLAVVSLIPMVLTGYLIQTATGAGWLRALAVAHIAAGLVYTVGVVAHRWVAPRGNHRRGSVPIGEAEGAGLGLAARQSREDDRAA